MLDTIKRDWKGVVFQSVTIAASFIALLIITSVLTGNINRAATAERLADQLLRSNLAQACELALPVGDMGRDPDAVTLCFTQYELEPPIIVGP